MVCWMVSFLDLATQSKNSDTFDSMQVDLYISNGFERNYIRNVEFVLKLFSRFFLNFWKTFFFFFFFSSRF